MTLDEIKKANGERKAIRDRATRGPWFVDATGKHRVTEICRKEGIGTVPVFWIEFTEIKENVDFIIHARTDPAPEHIDRLMAEVERLRLQVQEQSETESRLRLAVAREIDTVAHLRTRLQEAEEEVERLERKLEERQEMIRRMVSRAS